MRVLKVVGFIWVCFDWTIYAAFKTFPVNFDDFPFLTTNPWAVLMNSGVIYGFSILYFYAGFHTMHDRLQSLYVKK